MKKRKLSASVIILFIAATTLISGTYAWFMVGGFASMFKLDYNCVQAGAGIEIQGSKGDAYTAEGGTKQEWGSYVAYDNFNDGELIKNDGSGFYTPVSLQTKGANAKFVKVGLKGDVYSATEGVKGTNYNDFSINLRGATDAPANVEMKIKVEGTPAEGSAGNPTEAGRIAVTVDGTTTVFALNDTSDSYVTSVFGEGAITDNDGNQVITSADTAYAAAGLTSGSVTKLDENGNISGTEHGLAFELGANRATKTVYVQTWLEGNDPNCIDVTKGGIESIAGGSFVVSISFTTVD